MADAYQIRLWGGRFKEDEDAWMERFNGDNCATAWLIEPDVTGSLAHVEMQVKCGMLTLQEGQTLKEGLNSILADYKAGALPYTNEYEDVHTFVELNLIRRVGEVGKKLHTARSRNDQVNTDMKLFVRQTGRQVAGQLARFCVTLTETAQRNPWIMPGYTHLQRAQVVTMKHYLLAYQEMLDRDRRRIVNALSLLDQCPLGCGALAGTTHPIDRTYTAKQLGFSSACNNFLDGVSDRDYVIEMTGAYALLMMHLSRMAEELILWSSAEFGFITLDDRYTTGSSIMPQKKNADGAELVRGRTGHVYGNLITLLTMMKGLPLAYNKDMQEDKEAYYSSWEIVRDSLEGMERMVATMQPHPEAMAAAVKKGFLNATEVADYLVKKGMPFRDAHGLVGRMVLYCEEQGKAIEDLTDAELAEFSPLLEPDVRQAIDYNAILHMGNKQEML